MLLDLSSPHIIEWLAQFELDDQPTASMLLENLKIVGADAFAFGLRKTILAYATSHPGPVALYAERHIRRQNGKPDRMFKESRKRPRRAEGNGPAPVPPGRPYARETGSEGIIATLITGIVRAHPDKFLDHPGPDKIRSQQCRTFMVVTDFIGSGRRAIDNIESAWRVHSLKSWRSYGLLQFAVAAYSGTQAGIRSIEAHPTRPRISLSLGCPTIWELDPRTRHSLVSISHRYCPKRSLPEDRTPLGYNNTGALIAFDHGMPNNAPLLLHTSSRRWVPLFPRRSAALVSGSRRDSASQEEIERSLEQLRETRLSKASRFTDIKEEEQWRMLVLTALKRKPRTVLAVSARIGMSIAEVEGLIQRLRTDGLLDARLRPTKIAYNTLQYLRTSDPLPTPIPKTVDTPYCPKSLRPPRENFG